MFGIAWTYLIWCIIPVSLSEMFQQHTMNKDIAAANFLQENEFANIVEEVGIIPGHKILAVKNET